ncbi:MAG: hypothetical protein NXI10_05315 [bacterium]|nr:hypothetical protein [bacterium]
MKKSLLQWEIWVGCVITFLWLSADATAQFAQPKARFVASDVQQFGFDDYRVFQWRDQYEVLTYRDSLKQPIPYKSMLQGSVDHVNLVLDKSVDTLSRLSFKMGDSSVVLNYTRISRDTLQLELPPADSNYLLKVYYNKQLETALQVINYEELTFKVKVIPLTGKTEADSLHQYLNRIYAQAGISLDVSVEERYKLNSEIDSIFANPSKDHDRYTQQMIEVRDDYFDQFGQEENTYYIFIVADFVAPEVQGYMVRNKGVGFVKTGANDVFYEIAHQLGYGIGQFNDLWKDKGPTKGTTRNLMDIQGTHLTHEQWGMIRSSGGLISYFDDFEDVRANNGIIAYYLWEENKDGTIKVENNNLLGAVTRPFKRNTYSLYLDIDNFLFYQLFDIGPYSICLLHFLSLFLMIFSSIWIRRRVVRRVQFIKKRWIFRFSTRILSFGVHGVLFWALFLLINEGYYMFEVDNGKIESLDGKSLFRTKRELFNNQNLRRKAEENLGSEVLIKKSNGEWILEKRKPVLYFTVRRKNGKRTLRFKEDSETLYLPTLNYRRKVKTHYFVYRYVDENDEIVQEKVFNHVGVDITEKLFLEDPAERIVLFVNGYRPTSLGGSFEDNFRDVQRKGLEFPNSSNVIDTTDGFNYWRPYKEIDLKFAKRLNATARYYADGHHSVSTSNHETLIDFTQHSLNYPKRCKNKNRHVCKYQKKGWKWLGLQRNVPTYETQPLDPNEDGFEQRRENGRIAGRNFLQMLNEIPSNSDDDTLFIVAHSMGYAYALGIIDVMRGKINFGGFYIIAAENAESGEVVEAEWEEIWQFGSDFEAHKISAPCLLDGIAPQTKAAGLSPRKRVYIPEKYYNRMGFFDSHFVGHYTWIFDIPEDEPGYIEQR